MDALTIRDPQSVVGTQPLPQSLIAELTHRCPLHCVYCSNPLEMQRAETELSTEDWQRVFTQAAALGIFHVHFTGGEPLARRDLPELLRSAHAAGLYVNMVTSGVGLSEARLAELVDAGLDHLQLSFQDVDEQSANLIAGARSHHLKIALAPIMKRFAVAFTVNLVIHRMNIDRLEEFITFAESLEPDRLEIAHVQYYGWALQNRSLLMPTAEQVTRSLAVVEAAKERLRGRIHLEAVVPDYFATFPKACVGGWGRQMMLIDPSGRVLPCHSAGILPGMQFDNVKERDLAAIWQHSSSFSHFRGDEWMSDTCRACDRKERDFGGCRCQAFQLTGDQNAIDPACMYSPHHDSLVSLRTNAPTAELVWRAQP